MELTSYLTAFSIGLLGSAHCMGMCGGITSALSLSLPDNNRHAIFRLMLGYHLGRIGSYALAGLILGTLGWFLGEINQSFQLALRWLAGGMLIAMGLYISGIWKGLTILEKAGGALWRKIQPAASRLLPVRTFHATLALGAFWGWLPCGLVYSTLIWSASHGNPHQSALLMACFGLGTLPAMLLTGLLSKQISHVIQARVTRNIAACITVFFGLWTLPGAHQALIMNLISGH